METYVKISDTEAKIITTETKEEVLSIDILKQELVLVNEEFLAIQNRLENRTKEAQLRRDKILAKIVELKKVGITI